jgi:hypothetical protein
LGIGHYLNEYFKINQLSFITLAIIGGLSLIKYSSVFSRIKISKGAALCVVLLLGLVLRIGWIQFSSHEPSMQRPVQKNISESDLINVHAIDLIQGRWFLNEDGSPSGRRPIGYPMVLSLCYKIFGVHLAVVWGLHLFLYLAAALLIYGIAGRLFGTGVALLSALFFSIYPTSVYSIKLITDEHLFLPVWYLGLYLLIRECGGNRYRRLSWLWYGLIFGYATMIRTHTIFMPVVIALAYWLKRWPWKVILGTSFLTLLLMQGMNAPWVIRNYKAWGVPVMYTATSCFLYAQYHPGVTPEGSSTMPQKGDPEYSEELEHAPNEGVSHQICSRLMKQFMINHPGEALQLGISRVLLFMNWNRWGGVWPLFYQYTQGNPTRPISPKLRKLLEELAYQAYHFLLHAFVLAVVLLIHRCRSLLPQTLVGLSVLSTSFFFWLLEHMIIYPDRKYRYPLEPLMMIVACYFLRYLICDFRWERLTAKIANLVRRPAGPNP